MKEWALQIIRCPGCGSRLSSGEKGGLACSHCGTVYPVDDGIADFLQQIHPTAERELLAVEKLDSKDPAYLARLANLLDAIDRNGLSATEKEEARDFPCLEHHLQSSGLVEHVLAIAPITPDSIVVEVGADHCLTSGMLLDRGARVVAVDITDHMKLAPRANLERLFRLKADMNRLPLDDESVDAVFAVSSIHHSWNLGRTLEEFHRVLRKRGRVYLCCEPMPSLLRYVVFLFGFGFGRHERSLGINERLFPRRTWLKNVKRAGLSPQLVFPDLSDDTIRDKLKRFGWPRFLVPVARRFSRLFQVSIHLIAEK